MNWKEYLKTQGYTDAEISQMETTFGADKMAKAFESPIRDKVTAEKAAADAKAEREEFERFYQDDVLPKISTVYQDAINTRTKNAALEERLKAAKDYGFLSDPAAITGTVPGMPPGTPVTTTPPNPVPGSPGPTPTTTLDPRYVESGAFTKAVTDIPAMLGRLTKMSNEHFSLFGSPLLDVDTLIAQAQTEKKNVLDIWAAKYKVQDRRDEIAKKKQEDHDRQIGEEAVRKYASEHGQPFTTLGRPSVATHFTPSSTEEARHPWKGAADRQRERRGKLLQEFQKSGQKTGAVQ